MKCQARIKIEKLCNFSPTWVYIDSTHSGKRIPKQLKWRIKFTNVKEPDTFTLALIKTLIPNVTKVKYCTGKKGVWREYLAIYFDCRPKEVRF